MMGCSKKRILMEKSAKNHCPYCLKESLCKEIQSKANVTVCNTLVEVDYTLYLCIQCHREFESLESDPTFLAREKYRKNQNLITVEELRTFLKKYKISHQDFSKLCLFDLSEITKIERGKIQNITNDTIIKKTIERYIIEN